MSFQATPDASVPVDELNEATIANDGFFPAIVMPEARNQIRIDGTITPDRLRASLIDAISSVNTELNVFKEKQIELGFETLEAVPSPQTDEISQLTHRYKRAVFCLAKANLVERYRDYDSSREGNNRADEMDETIGDLRRDYRWAVSDILGIPRTTIELI